jgi:hypothetical protein
MSRCGSGVLSDLTSSLADITRNHHRPVFVQRRAATQLDLLLFPRLQSLTLRVLGIRQVVVYARVAALTSLTALDVACPLNQHALLACAKQLPALRELALTLDTGSALESYRAPLADLAPWITRFTIARLELQAESPRSRSDGLRLDVLAVRSAAGAALLRRNGVGVCGAGVCNPGRGGERSATGVAAQSPVLLPSPGSLALNWFLIGGSVQDGQEAPC